MSRQTRGSFLKKTAAAGVAATFTICDNMRAVGIEPSKLDYTLGPMLEYDGEKEQFTNNPTANKLLTREYRKPFVVPENV